MLYATTMKERHEEAGTLYSKKYYKKIGKPFPKIKPQGHVTWNDLLREAWAYFNKQYPPENPPTSKQIKAKAERARWKAALDADATQKKAVESYKRDMRTLKNAYLQAGIPISPSAKVATHPDDHKYAGNPKVTVKRDVLASFVDTINEGEGNVTLLPGYRIAGGGGGGSRGGPGSGKTSELVRAYHAHLAADKDIGYKDKTGKWRSKVDGEWERFKTKWKKTHPAKTKGKKTASFVPAYDILQASRSSAAPAGSAKAFKAAKPPGWRGVYSAPGFPEVEPPEGFAARMGATAEDVLEAY